MKLILTDIDNVCLDWTNAFQEFVYKVNPKLKLAHDCWTFGLTYEEIDGYIHQFNDATVSDDFGNLVAYRDAVEYMTKLKNLGYEFVGITSCGELQKTKDLRQKNVEVVFGKGMFKEMHCLKVHSSKLECLKKYPSAYWIDDKVSNAADGLEAGHISFNMITPYNRHEDRPDGLIMVETWKEIFNHIMKPLIHSA